MIIYLMLMMIYFRCV